MSLFKNKESIVLYFETVSNQSSINSMGQQIFSSTLGSTTEGGRIGFDRILKDFAIFTAANLVANVILRRVLSRLPSFKDVPPKKTMMTTLYILSTLNALYGAGYATHYYALGGSSAPEQVLIDRAYYCVCIIGGYLVQDILMLLPEAGKHRTDLFHHGITVLLGFAATHVMPVAYPILPAFAIQEYSTPLLNLIWFSKEFPSVAAWTPVGRVKQAFALAFGVFRVIFFPAALYLNAPQVMAKYPPVVYLSSVFCCLQFYWFTLIVKKAMKAGGGK